jgi:pimeloyl-ACP methyl ester carboxylesterase
MPARPRLVLVHGSVGNGAATWATQAPLAERFELVVLERPGFPPGPPVDSVDFEEHGRWVAERLEPGDHLAGHSYGGIVSLLAAAERPELVRSLTVIEPPCFLIARGTPEADAAIEGLERHWGSGPSDPREFLVGFFAMVSDRPPALPDPLPPDLEQGARTLMVERLPSEAEIPFEPLAAAPFPKLAVSGGHSGAFDRVCEVLEERIGAERLVVRGAGHNPQFVPGFNEAFADFLDWAG